MIYSTVNHQELPFSDPTHRPLWWRNTWMPPKARNQRVGFSPHFIPPLKKFMSCKAHFRPAIGFSPHSLVFSYLSFSLALSLCQIKHFTFLFMFLLWHTSLASRQPQRPRTDLNKRFLPRPNTTTAWKLIPHRSNMSKNKNPTHWELFYKVKWV